MSGAISETSEQVGGIFFQSTAKASTIIGGVTTLACAILGYDCTYPLTFTVLGACTWYVTWITQSAYEDAMPHQNNPPLKKDVQKDLGSASDALGASVKKILKDGRDKVVETGSTAVKVAVLSSSSLNPLAPVLAPVAGSLVTAVGKGTKDISDKSIDSSVDSSENFFVAKSASLLKNHK